MKGVECKHLMRKELNFDTYEKNEKQKQNKWIKKIKKKQEQ